MAVALALIIGSPALRLKGIYFAIGTLGLGQILDHDWQCASDRS